MQQLPGAVFYEIGGLSCSVGGHDCRVEIPTGGCRSWKDSDIRGTAQPMAHTRFSFDWDWDGADCVLQSRCIAEIGQIQPSRLQALDFWSIVGLRATFAKGQDNSIQPWRVASDGGVHIAII